MTENDLIIAWLMVWIAGLICFSIAGIMNIKEQKTKCKKCKYKKICDKKICVN